MFHPLAIAQSNIGEKRKTSGCRSSTLIAKSRRIRPSSERLIPLRPRDSSSDALYMIVNAGEEKGQVAVTVTSPARCLPESLPFSTMKTDVTLVPFNRWYSTILSRMEGGYCVLPHDDPFDLIAITGGRDFDCGRGLRSHLSVELIRRLRL